MGFKKVSVYRQPPADLANWFASGNSFALPPGKYYGVTPAANYPDSTYLNGGATHVGINWGEAIIPYCQQTGLDISKTLQFYANPTPFQGFRPSKTINNWTDDECDDFVRARAIYPGLPNMAIFTREDYNGSWDWRPEYSWAPRQVKRIFAGFGVKMDAMNGWLSNEYGGAIDYISAFDQNQDAAPLTQALSSSGNAISFMKANENGWTAYFGARFWENMDCLVNTYQMLDGAPGYKFLYRALVRLAVVKLAMSDPEVTRKRRIFTYYMPEGAQTSYGENFKTYVDAGYIQTDSTTFPRWHYGAQVFQGCAEYLFADARVGWGDALRHGTDKHYVRTGKTVFGQTQTPEFRNISYVYKGGVGQVGYDSDSAGYNNAQEDGARWYSMIYAWTGSTNWNYCRYRNVGGSYCSNGFAYLVERYHENRPLAFVFSGVNGRKALLVFTSEDSDSITYQFDIGGSSPFEINLAPNAPHLFLID